MKPKKDWAPRLSASHVREPAAAASEELVRSSAQGHYFPDTRAQAKATVSFKGLAASPRVKAQYDTFRAILGDPGLSTPSERSLRTPGATIQLSRTEPDPDERVPSIDVEKEDELARETRSSILKQAHILKGTIASERPRILNEMEFGFDPQKNEKAVKANRRHVNLNIRPAVNSRFGRVTKENADAVAMFLNQSNLNSAESGDGLPWDAKKVIALLNPE